MPDVSATRYAVLVRCRDGREFLASGNDGLVHLNQHRKDALKYADELAEHIPPRRRLKVVRVAVTIEVIQ